MAKYKMTKEVLAEVLLMNEQGYTSRQIAEKFDLGKSTVGDFLRGDTHKNILRDERGLDHGSLAKPESQPSTAEVLEDFSVESDVDGIFRIETTKKSKDDCVHFVIPDTQMKPGVSTDYLSWVGKYIVDRKPDVIIHLGDHADMPSLSSYDRGKRSAEGRRVNTDIESAIDGMKALLEPLYQLQQEEKQRFGKVLYKPKMVFTLGNHEERIMRHVNSNPELSGFLSYDNLRYEDFGWEVYDFLKPAIVNGVAYVHYMANPMSGKPYGGMAMNVLKNVGESFTMGHKQTLDIATRFLPATGRQQWAIIAGSCYTHDESYKGHQGNHHWRGVIVKHNVVDGSYNPMMVDLGYLETRYGK